MRTLPKRTVGEKIKRSNMIPTKDGVFIMKDGSKKRPKFTAGEDPEFLEVFVFPSFCFFFAFFCTGRN